MPTITINGGEKIPQNKAEFDAFLTAYKAKNPVKFATKEAKGEFEKLRRSLLNLKKEEVEEEVEEKIKEEKPRRLGRPPKEKIEEESVEI